MSASRNRWSRAAIAVALATSSAVAITTPAEATLPFVVGSGAAVTKSCLDIFGFPPTFQNMSVASVAISVSRSNDLHLPKASLVGGTSNTFSVKVHIEGITMLGCPTGPFIPTFTLPPGVHIDPAAAFPIICTKNGIPVTSGTTGCPGKGHLVRPVAGGPTSYRSSASDFTWPLDASDIYDFEFPVYSDRVFIDRPVSASMVMVGATAGSSSVNAAAFRPALTCNGKAVTVATQFGEAATIGDDVISGGAGLDRISGGFGNDTICGGPGNDVIDGGPGNDTIVGGPGNDLLSGGTGTDTASYFNATAVKVDLGVLGPQATGGAGTDTLGDFENLVGGNGSDILTGNSRPNRLVGGKGTDTCNGAGGTDTAVACEHLTAIP